MKIPVKYIDTRKYIATVMYDDMADDPTEWGDFTIETFGNHNGISINVDDYSDDNGKLLQEYQDEVLSGKRFWLDRYEHRAISYSLTGGGIQCQFDTSNCCGFIVLDDERIKGDTYERRKEYALEYLDLYNNYINGNVYTVSIKTDTGIEIDDWCNGFYGSQAINTAIADVIGKDVDCEICYV
jgi:hypothetical protein